MTPSCPQQPNTGASPALKQRVDVILPAGGRISGEFAEFAGVESKALIQWGERTILQRTLETFRALEGVNRVTVIGGGEVLEQAREYGVEGVVQEGSSGPENIFRGLEWLRAQENPAERVVIATTDLPFLSPAAVAHFLNACRDEVHIGVPVIWGKTFDARFPGTVSEYVPLKEGQVTVGCVFQISPEALFRARKQIETLFEARKNIFAMARAVGMGTILRLLTRQLAVRHIEDRCQKAIGCSGYAVMDAHPELAYDIDTIEDYRIALKHFAESEQSLKRPN
ncbi:MAG: nucleotidyltransferase family protein [Armatimonadetes bacterium]|nr:nucleotidyltransferase family protein [Armatimonadota bacterium]